MQTKYSDIFSTLTLTMVIYIHSQNFIVILEGLEIKMHANLILDPIFHPVQDLWLNTREKNCRPNFNITNLETSNSFVVSDLNK